MLPELFTGPSDSVASYKYFILLTPKQNTSKSVGLKVQNNVALGENLSFSFLLKTQEKKSGKCCIEFAIDFVKANGSLNRKVFKVSESDYDQKKNM